MAEPNVQRLLLTELDAVYRLAFHLASRPQDVDDVVQETYLRALRAADRFELHDFGPRPWLFKILHNVIATRYQMAQRDDRVLRDLPATDAAAADAGRSVNCLTDLRWDQIDEQLKQAINDLPLVARMTFLLFAVEGLKYREIAAVTDVPVGTVMSRLSRAREQLVAKLADYARERGWHRPATNEATNDLGPVDVCEPEP